MFFAGLWVFSYSALFFKSPYQFLAVWTHSELVKDMEASGKQPWPCGVMVSTLDSESSDPSSNLGRTCPLFFTHTQC